MSKMTGSLNPNKSGISIGNGYVPKKFTINTKKGDIILDLDNGDITFPIEVGRDEAIQDFWLGFQKHFGKLDKPEPDEATLKDQVKSKIIDKVRKKYASEKFIMIKPDDLIKFLEND